MPPEADAAREALAGAVEPESVAWTFAERGGIPSDHRSPSEVTQFAEVHPPNAATPPSPESPVNGDAQRPGGARPTRGVTFVQLPRSNTHVSFAGTSVPPPGDGTAPPNKMSAPYAESYANGEPRRGLGDAPWPAVGCHPVALKSQVSPQGPPLQYRPPNSTIPPSPGSFAPDAQYRADGGVPAIDVVFDHRPDVNVQVSRRAAPLGASPPNRTASPRVES